MWKANKFVNILLWVLAAVSVAICGYVFVKCGALDDRIPEQKAEMLNIISPMFIWAYLLIGLTLLLIIVMSIPNIVGNPKSAIGPIIAVAALAVVIVVAYLLSDDGGTDTQRMSLFTPGHDEVSAKTFVFAGVNIISSYIMLGGTLLAMIFSGISGLLKSK